MKKLGRRYRPDDGFSSLAFANFLLTALAALSNVI